jgi:hypothetical protein
MISQWLAEKLAAPILLAVSIFLLIVAGVQTIRLEGVSFFGQSIINGYKPLYTDLMKENLQAKVTSATAALKDSQARSALLENQNKKLSAELSILHTKWDNYVPAEVIKYVPQPLRSTCVPNSLLWMLDAAGTGQDISTAAARSDESGDACSGMDVPSAAAAIMRNVAKLPEANIRIESARAAWQEQYELMGSSE